MAAFNKVTNFLLVLGKGTCNLTSDAMSVALFTNAWSTSTTAYSVTNETSGTGYTAGGATCTATGSTWAIGGTGSTYVLYNSVAATTWTAGATWTFRYVVYYDNTASGKPIVGWYDYGSDVTLNSTDTFTVTPSGNTLFYLN